MRLRRNGIANREPTDAVHRRHLGTARPEPAAHLRRPAVSGHGLQKLAGFPSPLPGGMHVPVGTLLWFAGIVETVGGILVTLGLLTRPAAFIMSGEIAIAYFMTHAPHSFWPALNGGETAILFCFVFLYLAAAGGGVWSVDAARGGARKP